MLTRSQKDSMRRTRGTNTSRGGFALFIYTIHPHPSWKDGLSGFGGAVTCPNLPRAQRSGFVVSQDEYCYIVPRLFYLINLNEPGRTEGRWLIGFSKVFQLRAIATIRCSLYLTSRSYGISPSTALPRLSLRNFERSESAVVSWNSEATAFTTITRQHHGILGQAQTSNRPVMNSLSCVSLRKSIIRCISLVSTRTVSVYLTKRAPYKLRRTPSATDERRRMPIATGEGRTR